MGIKVGTILTTKSFERFKAQAKAFENDQKADRGPIDEKDIEYLTKALEAPDVQIFLEVI